jgi:hypothetical protein
MSTKGRGDVYGKQRAGTRAGRFFPCSTRTAAKGRCVLATERRNAASPALQKDIIFHRFRAGRLAA